MIVDECGTMVSPSTASTVELAMSSLSNTSAILIGSSLSTMLGPPSSGFTVIRINPREASQTYDQIAGGGLTAEIA